MTNDLSQGKLDEKKIIAAIAGALLLLSVFFPWFSVSGFGIKASVSPSDFSQGLVWAGALAGAAAIGMSFLGVGDILESFIDFAAGVVAILSFFVIIASRSSGMDLSGVNVGGGDVSQVIKAMNDVADMGFYIYFIAAGVLIVVGLIGMARAENSISAKKGENDQESTE